MAASAVLRQSSKIAADDVPDVFWRNAERSHERDLLWADLERLPTFDRARRTVITRTDANGAVGGGGSEVDIKRLAPQDKKVLVDRILKFVEEDNARLLIRLRARIDRVGIKIPTVEVRFQELSAQTDAFVGRRGLPTLLNATVNMFEGIFPFSKSKKRINILRGVSGIIRPSRMTLLLGPPGSGKTTLLLALAGRLDKKLQVSGKITYCGHEFSEFVPQRTSAYISQHDLHHAEMTVRETLDFSGRCLGVGNNFNMLLELIRREKDAGIKPDPEVDAFMKAISLQGQNSNLVTDYIIKILGLDICSDVLVGNEMLRGISGGQKKRVTAGEMLVGPAKALFMDEISNGLDSSTTFQIIKYMRQMVHVLDGTMLISLLQPSPETFSLFDDIILLSEGQIVYQGPLDRIMEFFEVMGFKCPERKGVADFLQEVTSENDQEQYWFRRSQPYKYISATEFAKSFNSFYVGQQLIGDLRFPYDKSTVNPDALSKERYGISKWKLFKVCFARECLLMKRNSPLYIFKATQLTIMSTITMTLFLRTQMRQDTFVGGGKYLGVLFFGQFTMIFNGMVEFPLTILGLPMFYKQRDFLFYPAWAYGLPTCLLKIPVSMLESGIWVAITYYGIGFAPVASRFFKQFLAFFCTHQMAVSLFRFVAAAGRNIDIAGPLASFILMIVFVLGGFIISKDDILPYWLWGYWISPLSYAQNAIAINEFLDPRWNTLNSDGSIDIFAIGKTLLAYRGIQVEDNWYWISIGALVGFCFLFNACFIAALTYLNPWGHSQPIMLDDSAEKCKKSLSKINQTPVSSNISVAPNATLFTDTQTAGTLGKSSYESVSAVDHGRTQALILPFKPLSLSFDHINYFVDMPSEMKSQGIEGSRLQLLCDVSGAFKPGVLTALVGVSGAGKTTLMDVLAGRKTGGYIEGTISISGYPKDQAKFARISGYCEQNDIHSPCLTVFESLIYSATLRLGPDVRTEAREMFVEEVIDLVELNKLKNSLVGLPGVDGLSTEQRKRLTIAVELVANPSILFLDEPTSGLDARSAAIVMRAVRNTVNTGRTVTCTIHQPSIDIFEAFDELLLLKRGGRVIYAGPLGHHSHKLIEYFEAIPGIPKIKDGYNPATWMLEISYPSVEARLGLDFAELYSNSSVYKGNQDLVRELSTAAPGSKDLFFPVKYSQSFTIQYIACFWKQYWSYWRNPKYNVVRFIFTFASGILFGTIFWRKGDKIAREQDLLNLLGAIYSAVLFLGISNANAVQPVVAVERTVFYRERAAGMYSAAAYAFAQVTVEFMYVTVQSLIYGVLLYFMIGFGWRADRFLWFLYFIFMSFLYFTMCGMMMISLTPAPEFSMILMGFCFTLWNLFSGFLVTTPQMPEWWRWYARGSPTSWTLYGLMVSQVGDIESLVDIPGQESVPLNVFLHTTFGYEHRHLTRVALIHVAFVFVFFLVFTFCIKFLNFQKR